MLPDIPQHTEEPPTPKNDLAPNAILPLVGNSALQGIFLIPLIKMRKLGLRGAHRLAIEPTTCQ